MVKTTRPGDPGKEIDVPRPEAAGTDPLWPAQSIASGQHPEPPATRRNKRPYAAPTLVSWGTLQEITLKVGSEGHADGGRKKKQSRTRD